MSYYVGFFSYISALTFSSYFGIKRYKYFDTATRILSVLVCCAFVTESAAYFFAKKYHNNIWVYNIFQILNFNLLCFYFNNVIDIFQKGNVGMYLAVSGTVAGIVDLLFIQHISSLNSYFLFLEGLLIIAMSFFAFFKLLSDPAFLYPHKFPHFLVHFFNFDFFWCITFLNWGLLNYININFKHAAWAINLALQLVNAITYGSIGVVFLLYPKMQKR